VKERKKRAVILIAEKLIFFSYSSSLRDLDYRKIVVLKLDSFHEESSCAVLTDGRRNKECKIRNKEVYLKRLCVYMRHEKSSL
jgi:hypothetical protein